MATASEVLREVPLFAELDALELSLLAERIDLVTAKQGDVLFHRGEPGAALYVLRTGVVELYFKNDTGHEIVLEVVRAGEFFGDISLLDPGPRTASARVVEDMEAFAVDREDLAHLFRVRPSAALDVLTATGRRLRETVRLLRHSASRDINRAEEDERTRIMKIADGISEFSGSFSFLILHVFFFALWIGLNVEPLASTELGGFDPFPFGLLTMVVSLEAIILSVFVLLSQNRQAARDRVRNDIEYEVNLKAELEVAHLHERVEHLQEATLSRLERIEKAIDALAKRP
ncbi:DUF1003 domain-containing protein [Myxococcota bacterium]|nr:DUF1003 domain-containing protein [Myxococcota bacterium]